jgi:hypothetical protein
MLAMVNDVIHSVLREGKRTGNLAQEAKHFPKILQTKI